MLVIDFDPKMFNEIVKGEDEMRDAIAAAVLASILKVAGRAKFYAPVKTGTLKRSITPKFLSSVGAYVLGGVVGSNLKYARMQEYGGPTSGIGKGGYITGVHYLATGVAESKPYIAQQFQKLKFLKR